MDCLKPYLHQFKNIFTLNYDSNVDMIVGHSVFHLHGTFNVLHHEYRPETFKGWAMLQVGKKLPQYKIGKEYLYCDAVLGFSGEDKLKKIKMYNDVYENPLTQLLLKEDPKLEQPQYPIKQFKTIKGQLHLIGVCPNNDSHIFQMINENSNITQVIYYSACDADTAQIQNVIDKDKNLKIEDVFKYWGKIRGDKSSTN